MRKPLNLVTILSLALVVGCSKINPTAPSAVVSNSANVVAEVATVVTPPIFNPAPIIVTPPIAADPIPTPAPNLGRPFNRNDCDYSNLGAIRCYNPSNVAITLTAALTSLDNKTLFSSQTVTIQPFSNGYFTLGWGNYCGVSAQIDFFRGSSVGDVRNPDFAAERVYNSPACVTITIPPPPACVPKWNDPPWVLVNTNKTVPVYECKKYTRELSDGCGNKKVENNCK